jgi:hypothetical protein
VSLANTGKGFTMLLMNRLKKNSAFYAMAFIVFVFCMAQSQYTIANDDLNQLDKLLRSLGIPQSEASKKNDKIFNRILQAYSDVLESDDKETKELLTQWDNYLISVSHYSKTEYANALDTQVTDYRRAIADIENISKKTRAKRKNEYSSSWVDDLINHFGEEFVKKNKIAVNQSLLAISTADDEAFEKKLKDLIYIETMLFGSYKDYFGMFLDFYKEELDDNAQKKLGPRKIIAENFLALIDKVSLTSIHDKNVLRTLLADNKARQLNNEVFMFLKGHPVSHTLEFIRALEDFKKAIGN